MFYYDHSIVRILCQLFALCNLYIPVLGHAEASVEELLDKGTKLLASGQLAEALAVYVQAVDQDPKNHMACFRRGTAYLAMGNARLALPDFNEAIRLRYDFYPAIKQRGNVLLKMGRLSEAKTDYAVLENFDPEAHEKLKLIDHLEQTISEIRILYNNGNFHDALSLLNGATEVMNFDQELRDLRGACFLRIGDVQRGIKELRYGVHLSADNREGLLKVAKLMYDNGLAVQALEELRECLRLDHDNKGCMELYRKAKRLAKAITKAQDSLETKAFTECLTNAADIANIEPSNSEYKRQSDLLLCQCHARSNSEKGVPYCEVASKLFPQDLDLQCDLAESYINADQFEDAIRVCQNILGEERRHQRARQLLSKAQKLLKNSQRHDYYKILGVSRTATKPEIGKAYRKLARKWHPDNYKGEDSEKAKREFQLITSAKEVLMDDEMRAKFDNGEDPLDPQQGQQFHNPFGGFSFANMHPFEGGHFEFHFG